MIVLDTHAWVWWLAKPKKLGKKGARAIDKANRIGISAISIWEVAAKVAMGKLRFDRPCDVWIDEALIDDARIELLHLLPRISIDAVRLSWPHQDPADRFIVATARAHDAILITADQQMHDSGLVSCVWE